MKIRRPNALGDMIKLLKVEASSQNNCRLRAADEIPQQAGALSGLPFSRMDTSSL